MKTVRWMKRTGMILIVLGLLRPVSSFALSGPPPLTDVQIGAWSFDDTNWLTDGGNPPMSFTNLENPSDWDGDALKIDSPHPAWLQYNIVENSGETNVAFTQGTIQLWFLADWNSGHGPGDSGRLIDVGAYSTSNPSSWWSLYFNPGGTNLYFSSETNGVFTNYLSVPISWASNNWHLVDLAYSSSGSQLYLDGQLMTNGAGSLYQPSLAAFTNGFFVGSDVTGTNQMRGQMDNLATFNYPLDAGEVAYEYQEATNSGTGGSTNFDNPAPDYGTNMFLTVSGMVSNTIPLVLTNSPNDVLLEIQGCTNLALGNWFSVGFVNGSELTNWTSANVYVSKQGNLFLRIRSWQDSTGTGIPDWWWLEYFGQTTNVDAYASDPANDGLTDLQKYQLGLDPSTYYNPNPPGGFFGYLSPSGTNAFIAWTPSPGPVVNYAIQRGIEGTNGNYVYSQIGLVSSNATFFEDVGAITNANAQNNIYTLTAVYPGGVFSGTNTWQVWWYGYYGSSGPPYGPPVPNNFYASVTSTGTNVQLSWTAPIGGAPTNYIIERGIFNSTSYAYNYAQIASLSTNTTNFAVTGAMTNANNWSDVYQIAAVYPGGGLSQPAVSYVNVGSTNGVAASGSFFGYPDSTGTNILLTWSPASGSVTHYIIYGRTFNNFSGGYTYTAIGEVSGSTTSFEVVGGTDGAGNYLYTYFSVVAVYADGSESQAAAWSVYSSTPTPGVLYAYLNATGTNVQLTWSAATGAITGYLIQRSDYDNYDYYQIVETASNKTSYVDTNEFNNAPYGIGTISYEVQAMYPNGGLSPAITTMVSNTPPVPTGLIATVDSTGTNVALSWNPPLGGVTNYNILVLRGVYNPSTGNYSYSQIGEVGGNTTSFEDVGAISGNNDNYIYELEATEGGSSISPPDASALTTSSSPIANLRVTAQLVRNQTGRWQLMFSAIPTNVTAVQLYIAPFPYDAYEEPVDFLHFNETSYLYDNQGLVDTIPVSSLTNGYFVIPDSITTNEVGDNANGKIVGVQPIGTANQVGAMSDAGILSYDAPCFVDGRQHLKQNLLFQLRAATISQPVGLTEHNVWAYGSYVDLYMPANTNCVESSIFHWAWMWNADGATPQYVEKDDLWPFTANYELNSFLYNTNYTGPSSFVWQTNLLTIPASPVLGISDPYWIAQPNANADIDPNTGLLVPPANFYGDLGAYTSGVSLYLQSSVKNLFGLTFETALVNNTPGSIVTVAPNGSATLTDVNCFYSQTADPVLTSDGYYFATVNTPGTGLPGDTGPNQPSPLPVLAGFASTNQTGLMVASVGTPIVIGGWNKFAVTGSSKYAYLGQYYITNAFIVTNGIVTTNTTGVVSPYGDFFPTQVGQVAMVTMPDINPPYEQGTGVVDVISLNVDANHDGTMDFSYGGPDFVSANKPFRFWANDDQDAFDDYGDGIPGFQPWYSADGYDIAGSSLYSTLPMLPPVPGGFLVEPFYRVHGTRDLVDYFPVYLNIGSLFQSNALSAGISVTDTNYQFILSQADSALRFVYTDLTPTNYMNFLRDTNEAESLSDAVALPIDWRGNPLSSSFIASIATNNGGILLVEAATNTTQPLVLTIYHGTNQIAQASLPLSISGVEQMFRSKTIMLNPESGTVPDRLTDADVPNEPDTTDKNFIFVHGYNVNPQQVRGWDSDFYKRMYWSGSHAKFYGVTWEASDSQVEGQVTIDLQTNVVNAFNTAPLLNGFLNSLSGSNVVAAHSLGNMLVLSTLNDCTNRNINTFFMIDAAVAMEAMEGYQGQTAPMLAEMIYSQWTPYANKLYASDWWQLFPTTDARSTLTWSNRLSNLQNANVYNFYSSGEEVLRATTSDPPTNLVSAAETIVSNYIFSHTPVASYMWVWQEKGKGRCASDGLLSSSHGGWKFNAAYYTNGAPIDSSQASMLSNAQLSTNAFFDLTSATFGSADLSLYGSDGSAYAKANRNRIISDAIPSLTLPVGANAVTNLDLEFGGKRNYDETTELENGWPVVRLDSNEGDRWHHSDSRQIAYTFTHNLFDDMVIFGGLK
jgi:hypothetical protein